MPATDPIDQRCSPSEFLDLPDYLLVWVGTPNDVQRPHLGIPETAVSAEGGVTVQSELLSNRVPFCFQNQGKRRP